MADDDGGHNTNAPTGGIFFTKGMRIGIPAGGFKLSISGTGAFDGDLH
jgi:hypothetical protein